MMPRRFLLALALIGLLSTCADPTSSGSPRGFGSLAVRVVTPPSLARFSPSLVIEQVKVVVGREFPQQELFVPIDSTAVSFTDTQNSISTRFRLLVAEADTLSVQVFYSAGDGTPLFQAFDRVVVKPGATIPTPSLQPFYVGPGSNLASISISPFDTVLASGEELTFDPQPFDVQGVPVPLFYISWATDDARVPIDARGHVVAPPSLTKLINVTATAPNGVVGTQRVTIAGPAALGISPDSIEKLPNATQLFRVAVGALRTSQFVWSVNGVDGGNATVGTINVDGTYTAPATTPTPSKVSVCARDAASQVTRDGCAVVVIRAVPTVGADVIVINDQNIFDGYAMSPDSAAGNRRFVRNLVNFSGTGPRASGKAVLYDRSRNSPCLSNEECSDTANAQIDAVIQAAGYTISKLDFYTPLTSIPPNVKVIFMWMPTIFYTEAEVNVLKRFAAEGGRIVFIGERIVFYTQTGIDVENGFLANMGSQMFNLSNEFDCGFYASTPSASLRTNPLLQGVNRLLYACAAEIQAGSNDFPLFYDLSGTHLLAAVAKVDVTPIQGTRQRTSPFAARPAAALVPGARGMGGERH
jgi:hypothetical protein